MKTLQQFLESSNPRIARKKGQPAKSKKNIQTYIQMKIQKEQFTDLDSKMNQQQDPVLTKIRKSNRSHAHKIQAAIAMEQRARVMGKSAEAAIYRKFINSMKKKTKK